MGADPVAQLVIDEELKRAGVRRPLNPIGIGWAGPTLVYAGTPEQQARWLGPILSGEEFWCQLFSEPGPARTWRRSPPGRCGTATSG